ncbi:MAG: T9SS type A sorting domain-containing protein, partial [Bacteroidota bacterium]
FIPLATQDNIIRDNKMRTYSQQDENPKKGNNFYRIKLVLDNGKVHYSKIKSLNLDSDPNPIALYPNPAFEEIFLNMEGYQGKACHIMIHNNLGQLVMEQSIEQVQTTELKIPLNDFIAGSYAVRIQIQGQAGVTKSFVVIK